MFKRDDTVRHLRDEGGRTAQLDQGGLTLRNSYAQHTGGQPEMWMPRAWAESLAAEIIAYYADLDAA